MLSQIHFHGKDRDKIMNAKSVRNTFGSFKMFSFSKYLKIFRSQQIPPQNSYSHQILIYIKCPSVAPHCIKKAWKKEETILINLVKVHKRFFYYGEQKQKLYKSCIPKIRHMNGELCEHQRFMSAEECFRIKYSIFPLIQLLWN